jgi:hypothetical protein
MDLSERLQMIGELSFELQDVVSSCQRLQVQLLVLGVNFDNTNSTIEELKIQFDEFKAKADLIPPLVLIPS